MTKPKRKPVRLFAVLCPVHSGIVSTWQNRPDAEKNSTDGLHAHVCLQRPHEVVELVERRRKGEA